MYDQSRESTRCEVHTLWYSMGKSTNWRLDSFNEASSPGKSTHEYCGVVKARLRTFRKIYLAHKLAINIVISCSKLVDRLREWWMHVGVIWLRWSWRQGWNSVYDLTKGWVRRMLTMNHYLPACWRENYGNANMSYMDRKKQTEMWLLDDYTTYVEQSCSNRTQVNIRQELPEMTCTYSD